MTDRFQQHHEDPVGTCGACCEDFYDGQQQECPMCGLTVHTTCVERCTRKECQEEGCRSCMIEEDTDWFCGWVCYDIWDLNNKRFGD